MTDIYIRKIPDQTLTKLDRKVAKLNQVNHSKLSRNDYIKLILANDTDHELENYERTKFDLTIEKLLQQDELLIELFKLIIHCFADGETTEALNFIDNLPGLKDNRKE